jgi:sugar phosphate isomerase/epimerase
VLFAVRATGTASSSAKRTVPHAPASEFSPLDAVAEVGGSRLSGLTLVSEEAPAPVRRRARLALGQPTTRRWTMSEDFAAVAECGLDAVALWNGKFRSRSRREVAREVRQSGVAVSSLSWVGGFTEGDAFDRDQAWFEAGEAIKLAGEVGARCVCVATGGAGTFTERHAARNLIPGTLQKLGAMAAEWNLCIAVQPLPGRMARNSVVRSVFDTLRLLDRTGRSNVGMALPTLLMARDRSLVNRVSEFADAVKLVKLSDCRVSGARGERCSAGRYPGQGSLPLEKLVTRLGECGFVGDYELDVRNPAAWAKQDHGEELRRSVRWFHALHGTCDD